MTKADLIKMLIDVNKVGDIEESHRKADELLLAWIDDADIKEAYDKIDKYYA